MLKWQTERRFQAESNKQSCLAGRVQGRSLGKGWEKGKDNSCQIIEDLVSQNEKFGLGLPPLP